jgi:hypothetical protein
MCASNTPGSALEVSEEEPPALIEETVFEKADDNVSHNETKRCDTIIGNYRVAWIIRDNDEIIENQYTTEDGPLYIRYADRSVYLWLEYNGKTVLSNKEINKHTFASIIPRDEISKYQLWHFGIENITEDEISFDLNICMPDTDICYRIKLCVSKDGEISMTELEQVWEEWPPN